MHEAYFPEQWVMRFLELGCPMPVDIEAVIARDGMIMKKKSPSCQSVEKLDVLVNGGDDAA